MDSDDDEQDDGGAGKMEPIPKIPLSIQSGRGNHEPQRRRKPRLHRVGSFSDSDEPRLSGPRLRRASSDSEGDNYDGSGSYGGGRRAAPKIIECRPKFAVSSDDDEDYGRHGGGRRGPKIQECRPKFAISDDEDDE